MKKKRSRSFVSSLFNPRSFLALSSRLPPAKSILRLENKETGLSSGHHQRLVCRRCDSWSMDFNKEEAVRARGIAEEKLWNNDFGGARRIALRAKKLDSELDSINHILSVCDVHCAAENRINGKEMDWYGILQMEQTGDESTIKRQYRKLALLLHPDKNRYSGAEAAFKLIREAEMVLLDGPKRRLHDSVRANSAPAKKPSSTDEKPQVANNMSTPAVSGQAKKNPPRRQPRAQPKAYGKPGAKFSVWTECSFCQYKNDFIVGKLGSPFICESCRKTFIPRTMSFGTKKGSQATTGLADASNIADPATWYEKLGVDDIKGKGSRKRGAGACEAPGKDVKRQCRSSNTSNEGCKAATNCKTKAGAEDCVHLSEGGLETHVAPRKSTRQKPITSFYGAFES
uniref:J domain-containing protein n=1 Tax=Kalanchoe fedtschenkoi TaxID=63787 RepID=A0A7N0ZRL8_KALFE